MELIVGKKYNLISSSHMCHIVGTSTSYDNVDKYNPYIYVGQVDVKNARNRNIFITNNYGGIYVMFGSGDPIHYATPHKVEISLDSIAEMFEVNKEDIKIIN